MNKLNLTETRMMERAAVLKQLNEIFKDVFDDNQLNINDSTSSDNIEEWNSLLQISLVLAVQNYWGFTIESGEMIQLDRVDQFVDLIMRRNNVEIF
jgi:acyl carrier protein